MDHKLNKVDESGCASNNLKDIIHNVVTLALGSRPMRRLARVWAKSKARESHLMLARVYENVRE